jgi:adenosylhomocysteine nucleosidase
MAKLSAVGLNFVINVCQIDDKFATTQIAKRLMSFDTEHLKGLLNANPLFVFALESEAAAEFTHVNHAFVGIGKVNATYHLQKHLSVNKPSIVVNLGTAGSSKHVGGEVVCCTRFVQRDMDVTALGFEKYQTPFSTEPVVLEYGLSLPNLAEETCGTGDNFEVSHATSAYDVVDMEAFSLAWVAKQEGVPFLCLKYISDGADGEAATDWQEAVHLAAVALKKTLTDFLNS